MRLTYQVAVNLFRFPRFLFDTTVVFCTRGKENILYRQEVYP